MDGLGGQERRLAERLGGFAIVLFMYDSGDTRVVTLKMECSGNI